MKCAIVLLLALLAGCSGSDSGQPFAKCGNGVVDSGEQCDPGFVCDAGPRVGSFCAHSSDCGDSGHCPVNDNGACSSTCEIARCGDGLVQTGLEECDGRNLAGASCSTFERAGGPLACSASCQFELAACGATFTPISTSTPTPPPTATATELGGTPTPPPLESCGNGDLDAGESCDDGNRADGDVCPPDCTLATCEPSAEQLRVVVSYASQSGRIPSSLSLLLTYPDGVVSIPGSANEAAVRERVTGTPMGAIAVRNDLDYQLRMVISQTPNIALGQLFTVQFDRCLGEGEPPLSAFRCRIERASDRNGPFDGVTCEVSLAD